MLKAIDKNVNLSTYNTGHKHGVVIEREDLNFAVSFVLFLDRRILQNSYQSDSPHVPHYIPQYTARLTF